MNIFFRTDSSLSIGTGHLSRCINLADELKKMNNNIFFISRNLPGNSNFIIKKEYLHIGQYAKIMIGSDVVGNVDPHS